LGSIKFKLHQTDNKFSQQSEASSIHGVGYKVIKKNGTKFLIKDRDIENTEKQIIPVQDDQCLAEELLAQINHEFNYKNNQLHLSFGESSPEDYGIHNLSIKLEPDWQYGKNNETLHNIYTVNLPTDQKEVSLPLNIYKTEKYAKYFTTVDWLRKNKLPKRLSYIRSNSHQHR
jgi:hypothetical protein